MLLHQGVLRLGCSLLHLHHDLSLTIFALLPQIDLLGLEYLLLVGECFDNDAGSFAVFGIVALVIRAVLGIGVSDFVIVNIGIQIRQLVRDRLVILDAASTIHGELGTLAPPTLCQCLELPEGLSAYR